MSPRAHSAETMAKQVVFEVILQWQVTTTSEMYQSIVICLPRCKGKYVSPHFNHTKAYPYCLPRDLPSIPVNRKLTCSRSFPAECSSLVESSHQGLPWMLPHQPPSMEEEVSVEPLHSHVFYSKRILLMISKFWFFQSIGDSLIARIPPGTAAASALDRIAWILVASFTSSFDGDDKFSKCQSFIEASGAKFGIPLTVPWPPHFIHGVRSAIRPSRRRKGNFLLLLMVESSDTAALRRISLPMLPPHLVEIFIQRFRSALFNLESTHVNFTPQRLFAFRITESIISEDISWPPALAGKLYRSKGIFIKISTFERQLIVILTSTHRRCRTNIDVVLDDLFWVCVQTRCIIGRKNHHASIPCDY